MPSFTMLSETESSSSGSGRMERIKPEKIPRQRVQKIWRNVRWATGFPDETVHVEANDITPHVALRKVALLFETKKYDECATIIRKMNYVTLGSILAEVPLEVLYDSMPYSLAILEALYVKLYESNNESFPKDQLCLDQLLKRMVVCFAKLSHNSTKTEKYDIKYYPSCRNILRVVLSVEPQVKRQTRQKRRALDRCLKHLGRHGLVDCSNGHLMQLHDAMKLQLEQIVSNYRSALLTLDELSLVTTKHPASSSVSFGKAPSAASHQRLMQMTRTDVQSRIIKNKTLYNIVEPTLTNQCLKKLMTILEKRIEYDKLALFHDTELRKLCEGLSEETSMCMTLRLFAEGYGVVCQLLKEVSDDEEGVSEDDGGQSTDDELLSPITHMDRIKTLPGQMNGFHNYRGSGGSTSRLRNGTGRKNTGLRPSIISGPFPVKPDQNGIRNGHANLVPHSLQYTVIPVLNGETNHTASNSDHVVTNGRHESDQQKLEIERLEREVDHLRTELQNSNEIIERLQEREVELNTRLANVAPPSIEETGNGFALSQEWVGHYAALYSHGRLDAMATLDRLKPLDNLMALKDKIIFSVMVLAFRATQQSVHEIRGKLRHLLNLPHPDIRSKAQIPVQQQMDCQIGQYLTATADNFDLSDVIQEVCSQIYATLFDYPCLKECDGLRDYVTSCVRVAWGLTVQNPPYFLSYDSRRFNPNLHTREETCGNQNQDIFSFTWPALTEGYGGPVVHKGIVIT
ncbi:uncharacterized protein LOC110462275 [Mizuhopecten yessoensis]|uniref:Mitochondria-eating protein n=1 Tax=Mizuhopecten yessoensis TaxID=6573 RepID=A0A210PYF9_MIZYE|nr:uncharacterized protein LOC110462275 [Mizuhopecten yessoensis]OWF41479.1 hypothetical protein KP79_PYT17368 [Mizuhopecten yessoensis]